MAHSYLPLLLLSVSANIIPDDSVLAPPPRSQVDYLSYEWQEEDIARSWRNMTRLKHEIANGMRLENASWRTWWKQRNKLKTVTPETLNWLKDSDVTWLYGPLHTAADHDFSRRPSIPVPPPPSSTPEQLDLCRKKPILKHRSISEQLTSDLHSPIFSPPESDDDIQGAAVPRRPALQHTKSESYLTPWPMGRSFRKESPPRIVVASENGSVSTASTSPNEQPLDDPGMIRPSMSEQDLAQPGRHVKKKRISFNPLVEQYIAIDKPKRRRPIAMRGSRRGRGGVSADEGPFDITFYDDGYDEDAEDRFEDKVWRGQDGWISGSDGDEEDDMIEMRTPSDRRSSDPSVSPTASKPPPSSASGFVSTAFRRISGTNNAYRPRPPLARAGSSDSHTRATIAPIEPTRLKMGDLWLGDGFGECDATASDDGLERWMIRRSSSPRFSAAVPSVGIVEGKGHRNLRDVVLHAPPSSTFGYVVPIDEGQDEGEEIYRTKDAYLDAGHDCMNAGHLTSPLIKSARISVHGCHEEPGHDDYFVYPEMGGEDSYGPTHDHRLTRRAPSVRHQEGEMVRVVRYAEGGAASVVGGRSNIGTSEAASKEPKPPLLTNDVDERRGRDTAVRSGSTSRSRSSERSRSESQSRSRTPSPLFSPTTSRLPSAGAQRERTQLLSAERERDRGRSSARGSSSSLLSDRERSGSLSAGRSPVGSLSPDGSAFGCGQVYAHGRRRRTVLEGESERGRGRSRSTSSPSVEGRDREKGEPTSSVKEEASQPQPTSTDDRTVGDTNRLTSTASALPTVTISLPPSIESSPEWQEPSLYGDKLATASTATLKPSFSPLRTAILHAPATPPDVPPLSPRPRSGAGLNTTIGGSRIASREMGEPESLVGRAMDIVISAGASILGSMWS